MSAPSTSPAAGREARPRVAGRRAPRWRGGRLLLWAIALAVLFGIWQSVLSLGLVKPMLLPTVADVLRTAGGLLVSPAFLSQAGVTVAEVMIAFLIAAPLGVVLGVAIGESRYWSRVLQPIIFTLFSIPKTIFLPMFILAFGINFGQKVGFGVFSTIFIVLISTFSALEQVKADQVLVARAYGATRRQIALRVYLPAMAPVLLEAVRVAMIFNVTGILLAEMYASRAGLGQLVSNWGENFMLKELLAVILVISAAAILFNETVRWFEDKCEHWRG